MPGYRLPRVGDLLAVRTTDPFDDEGQVPIASVVDAGDYLILSGAWRKTSIEVVIHRVGQTTLNPMEN